MGDPQKKNFEEGIGKQGDTEAAASA